MRLEDSHNGSVLLLGAPNCGMAKGWTQQRSRKRLRASTRPATFHEWGQHRHAVCRSFHLMGEAFTAAFNINNVGITFIQLLGGKTEDPSFLSDAHCRAEEDNTDPKIMEA